MLTPIKLQVDAARARAPQGQMPPVFVVVGATGAGKSLTSNWLLGKTLRKVKTLVSDAPSDDKQPVSDPDASGDDGSDDDDEEYETVIEVEDSVFAVGHAEFNSCTFAPNIVVHEEFILIDYPGLSDTNGFEIRLGMDLAFRAMLNIVKPAHILCLLPISSFLDKRGQTAREQLVALQRLLPTSGSKLSRSLEASDECASRWMVGVTKCEKDFGIEAPNKVMKKVVSFVKEWNPKFSSSDIVNINKMMFTGDSAESPSKLLEKMCGNTKTPTQPMACLAQPLKDAFGSGVQLGCVASDCLSVVDLAKFRSVLRAHRFEEIFLKKKSPGYQVKARSWKNGSDQSWSEAHALLKQEVAALKVTSEKIREDSIHLQQTKQLGLEARDPLVRELCMKAQAGLKLAFVDAEGHIMLRNAADTIDLFHEFLKLCRTLRDVKCLTNAHYNEIIEEANKVEAKLNATAESLGYLDALDFAAKKTWVLGGVVAGAGGLTLGLTIGCSASIAAGGLAGASGLAIAGLATGGVAIGIGAIIGLVSLGVTGRNYLWSKDFKETLVAALTELEKTNKALMTHQTMLTAVEKALHDLEVPP